MTRLRRGGIAALLAIGLAGCAGTPSPVTRPAPTDPLSKAQPPRSANLNLSGFSVAFKQGYADGCASGREREQHRNETRYKNEPDYTMGWNDGYSVCKR
ncbi:MAG TPA: hypothetical protein VKF40_22270 [Burkholderiales bacterium]|nr:hypothetical protein [Burkholderiales bacterium]